MKKRLFSIDRGALIIGTLALAALVPQTKAGGTVTNCTLANLLSAVDGGGTVTFACSGTIVLTNPITIPERQKIALIGPSRGGSVILSGGDAVRLFNVNPGAALTISNLTLANGLNQGADGAPGENGKEGFAGAIFNIAGAVTLIDCRLLNNRAIGGLAGAPANSVVPRGGSGSGGAILNDGGEVTLLGCLLGTNSAVGGDSASLTNYASLTNSYQRSGGQGLGGAVLNRGGTINITNGLLAANLAAGGYGGSRPPSSGMPPGGDGLGGAVYSVDGTVNLAQSRFARNAASGTWNSDYFNRRIYAGSGYGGAIHSSSGTLTAVRTTFAENTASGNTSSYDVISRGGAIDASLTSVSCIHCSFLTNSADSDGYTISIGGAVFTDWNTTVTDSAFLGNYARSLGDSSGGAICSSNLLSLTGCTLAGNLALAGGYRYGYGYGGGIYNHGTLNVTNSTIDANATVGALYTDYSSPANPVRGGSAGGGVFNLAGTVGLAHATVSANRTALWNSISDQTNSGLGGGIFSRGGNVVFVDSILAYSTSDGGNFVNDSTWPAAVQNLGVNISSDDSCNFVWPGMTNTDPKLGVLRDNGGPTPTRALLEGSPAIDAVDSDNCPATDQRGVARPVGPRCDVGAFEGMMRDFPLLSMTFSSYAVVTGSTVALTYTLRNPNPGPLDNVSFTNVLPAELQVAATPGVSNACGSGTVTALPASGTISVAGVTIPGRSECTIAVNVAVLTPALITNVVGSISATESGSASIVSSAVLRAVGLPSAVTAGSDVQEHSATLFGPAVPNGLDGLAWFEYGPTTAYGSQSGLVRLEAGYQPIAVSSTLLNLATCATVHYRLVVANSLGTSYGLDGQFTVRALGAQNYALGFDSPWSFELPLVEVGAGGGLNGLSAGTIELWARWNDDRDEWNPVFGRFGNFGAQGLIALEGIPGVRRITWTRQYSEPHVPTIFGATPVSTGVWHHVAVTFRPGEDRLYVDGHPEGTSFQSVPMGNDPLGILTLGGAKLGGPVRTNRTACCLDEVRLWSLARSQGEIQLNMNRPVPSDTPGLIALWRLDEDPPGLVHDATGHGFDGLAGLDSNSGLYVDYPPPFQYGMYLDVRRVGSQLHLIMRGRSGRHFVLQSSTDLLNWTDVLAAVFECPYVEYDDPEILTTPHRMYRLRSP